MHCKIMLFLCERVNIYLQHSIIVMCQSAKRENTMEKKRKCNIMWKSSIGIVSRTTEGEERKPQMSHLSNWVVIGGLGWGVGEGGGEKKMAYCRPHRDMYNGHWGSAEGTYKGQVRRTGESLLSGWRGECTENGLPQNEDCIYKYCDQKFCWFNKRGLALCGPLSPLPPKKPLLAIHEPSACKV